MTAPELGDPLVAGDHGSTFAGRADHRLGGAGRARVIDTPELLRSRPRARRCAARGLGALDGVAEVRGRGLMVGVSLAEGIDARTVATRCLDAGLVLNVPGEGMLRLLPPLVIDEADVGRAVETIGDSLA